MMKQKTKSVISWLASITLLFMLCACSSSTGSLVTPSTQSSPAIPSNSLTPSDSNNENANTQPPSNNANSALAAYKAVLQDKAEFYSTDNKKKVYLNGFLTNEEIYGVAFKATHLAILDMDGDKVPEVVIELITATQLDKYPAFYEVLHYMNGEVYGYIFGIRALGALKADGTFGYSNSAFDNGFGKLRFQTATSEMDTLGYEKPANVDSTDEVFFINNKQVTSAAYDSFIKEQGTKKDATWYEFSQESIDKELSVNP
jgi:hypothetical protein